jgi:hypothetical protein
MNEIMNKEEEKEIEEFFHLVETTKLGILNDIKTSGYCNGLNSSMSFLEIFDLFSKHSNLLNVISKKTVEVYVDSIFERENKSGSFLVEGEVEKKSNESNDHSYKSNDIRYIFTADSLEKFLTSILIFSDN